MITSYSCQTLFQSQKCQPPVIAKYFGVTFPEGELHHKLHHQYTFTSCVQTMLVSQNTAS